MNILVLGWYYSPNLGDAVLTECTAALLRRQYPQAHITVRDLIGRQDFPQPGGRPSFRGRFYRCLARFDRFGFYVNRHRADLDRTAAGDWDLAVFAGGQLFMDSLSIYISYLTQVFAERQIPVFFQACGMGPSWNEPVRRRLGQTLCLDNVKYCSCRDNVDRLNRWCRAEVSVPAADSALWSADVFRVSAQRSSGVLGLGIMDAGSLPSRRVFRFWQGLIRTLEQRKIPWKLFTNGAEADMAFARQLLARMPELSGPEEHYLCPAPKSPAELVSLIAGFDALVSFRLHSHIIACSLDIPTVGLAWDGKLRYFFGSIGHPERCLTVADTAERVLCALEKARQTGYDPQIIHTLRETSAKQLFDAMDPFIPKGETR